MMSRNEDDGFTMIELLLSVAILTIIIGAISAALITFLRNGTYTSERDDHSGGAAVLSSYFNRDFASADDIVVGGSSCSGSGTTTLTLRWSEWQATDASPMPSGGDPWRASYVITTDPTPAVGGGTRYMLERVLCPPVGSAQRSLMLRNLRLPTPAAPLTQLVQVVTPIVATADCPKGALEVRLPTYLDDTTAAGYHFVGCLKGRTR